MTSGLRKRGSDAFQDSSTVDLWCSCGARMFRNCLCRGARRRAAPHGHVRILTVSAARWPRSTRPWPRPIRRPGGTAPMPAAGSWSPSWAGSPAAVGDRIGARPWPGRVAWRWLPACPCKTPTPGRFARLATSPELRWRPPGEGRPVTVAMGCPSHARVVRPAREGAVV